MISRSPVNAVLAGLCLIGAACTAPSEPVEASSAPERPSKEDLLADFDAAMETANATRGPGRPSLWSISDEDTTVYLFGTVHMLRPSIQWRFDEFEQALDEADTIVFEADLKSEEGQRAVTRDFNQRGMFQDGRTLREALPDNDEALIEEALASTGMPMDAFNAFEPWMVAINLSAMKLLAEGYDLNSGVENVIEAEARAAGKTFGFLETVADQADVFDLLPEDVQISYLYETAVLLDQSPIMLDQIVSEWADGDQVGMEVLVADGNSYGAERTIYDALLVKRNRNWIPKIEDMLETPGTVLVAVGSAHLVGPDSVLEMLKAEGYTIASH